MEIESSLQGWFIHENGEEINFKELDHLNGPTGEYWEVAGNDGQSYFISESGTVVDEQDNTVGMFDPYVAPDQDRNEDVENWYSSKTSNEYLATLFARVISLLGDTIEDNEEDKNALTDAGLKIVNSWPGRLPQVQTKEWEELAVAIFDQYLSEHGWSNTLPWSEEEQNYYRSGSVESMRGYPDKTEAFEIFVNDVIQTLGLTRITQGVNDAIFNGVREMTKGIIPYKPDQERFMERGYRKTVDSIAKQLSQIPEVQTLMQQHQIPDYDVRQKEIDETYNGVLERPTSAIKQGAVREIKLVCPVGIHNGTVNELNKAGIPVTVQYPNGETYDLTKWMDRERQPSMFMEHYRLLDELGEKKTPDAMGNMSNVTVLISAPDDKIDEAIQIIQSGGMPRRPMRENPDNPRTIGHIATNTTCPDCDAFYGLVIYKVGATEDEDYVKCDVCGWENFAKEAYKETAENLVPGERVILWEDGNEAVVISVKQVAHIPNVVTIKYDDGREEVVPATSLDRKMGSLQKEAPGDKHLPYATPKRNRQYEHIKEQCLKDGGSEEHCKEMAARTVNKQRAEHGETKNSFSPHERRAEETYKIIRYKFDGENEVIDTGLTLEEAQEHCQREDTHGDGWFDGYDKEETINYPREDHPIGYDPSDPEYFRYRSAIKESVDPADFASYEEGEMDEEGEIRHLQKMINDGMWGMQGFYERSMMQAIEAGYCALGPEGHNDYYGSYVPSRYEVQEGTKGSVDFVREHSPYGSVLEDTLADDTPGNTTLEDMGIPPEGEDYFRDAKIAALVMPGDKVVYDPKFLKFIGKDELASASGVVNNIFERGAMKIADIEWDNQEAERRVNVNNLIKVGAKDITDSIGNPINTGEWYWMHSPKYKVPDVIHVLELEDTKIEAAIEGDNKGHFPLTITTEDIESNNYSFEPYISSFWIEGEVNNKESNWKLARKNFTRQEQKALIDENPEGVARNIHKMKLDGTHYDEEKESDNAHFLWGM